MSASQKLGVLLACGKKEGPFERAQAACRGAMDERVTTFLYLLHDGTAHVRDPVLQSLRQRGLRLFCCAFNARGRGIEVDDAAVYCGLGMLADILTSVDRFLSFTGSRWDGLDAAREGALPVGEPRMVQLRVWSDPAASDRVAEGVRVALGILSSGRLAVRLVFGGRGIKCLDPEIGATPEGAALATNLESFRERGGEVCVDREDARTETEGCFALLGF